MFDVLDDLEAAIDKLASDEGSVDVVRIWKLTERLLSPAAAIRHKTRCSHGTSMRAAMLEGIEHELVEFVLPGARLHPRPRVL